MNVFTHTTRTQIVAIFCSQCWHTFQNLCPEVGLFILDNVCGIQNLGSVCQRVYVWVWPCVCVSVCLCVCVCVCVHKREHIRHNSHTAMQACMHVSHAREEVRMSEGQSVLGFFWQTDQLGFAVLWSWSNDLDFQGKMALKISYFWATGPRGYFFY